MEINNPLLPKFKFGWYISPYHIINACVINPHYYHNGMIKVAGLSDETIHNNVENYLQIAEDDKLYTSFIYTIINLKDFFATKQQAKDALKTRTK